MKQSILFLCTGNSCRSQMAEGFAKKYWGEKFDIYSAGITKHGLNPRAVKVMEEVGIDISTHVSNTSDEVPADKINYVFTVCGNAHETCPHFSVGKIKHVGFDDPPFLTKDMSDEEEILEIYRRVRDEIENFVKGLDGELI
ncbi:arsenate reductase [Halobacteriovorax marinus]|uniref:Arsenate reductase n=1 Tax=Halobacteriovorax marinus TaxID=97084 RepID=A0A1Y5FC93_9BACT|nr:arsenate reductase [Halobacteriovorax marinus]